MAVSCVFFDLDDTIYMDRGSTAAVFAATCELARDLCGAPPALLEQAVRRVARERWFATKAECPAAERIGISSWASLWMPFPEADDPEWNSFRSTLDEYRTGVWRQGLAECAIADDALAEALARAFTGFHYETFYAFPGARDALETVAKRFRLGLITNGPTHGQMLKLNAIGMADLFDPIVTSEEAGVAKPDPGIFTLALERAGVAPADAVMVGNSLEADVSAARAVGMTAIWLCRDFEDPPVDFVGYRPRDLAGVARMLVTGMVGGQT